MNSNDPNYSPLRDVAQNPEATARYLADVQRVLLDIGRTTLGETMTEEARVAGDKRHPDTKDGEDGTEKVQPAQGQREGGRRQRQGHRQQGRGGRQGRL
ncbi:hypothetical protein SGRIM128S_07571 [Streptomyces griseomycini]